MMNDFKSINSISARRSGIEYKLTAEEIELYAKQGYLVLEDVLTDAEVATIDPWFDYFVSGKHGEMRRDFCDMSQSYDTPFEDYQLVNAMLPSSYRKELDNSIYEQVALSIAKQLYGSEEVQKDYDQFLAKKPGFEKAAFSMHQDLGYWPKTRSTWTATFSLALNDSDLDNGCLQVVPGSNNEPELREHLPAVIYTEKAEDMSNRESSHLLSLQGDDDDTITFLPVKRGSLTIHDERIVHGSAGNISDRWRQTYVMAFRETATVNEERAMGFTHSHNDSLDWQDVLSEKEG